MQISRVVVRNYRALENVDVSVCEDLCCVIGENNTGKSALLRAIQICLDVSLPSSYRALIREDIHTSVDVSRPSQVLIGVELTDFQGKVNEEALVSTWKIGPDKARIFYRFRPKPSIRERLNNEELKPGDLTVGVPVFGPGARPYQRKRTFAAMAEQLGACVEQEHLLGLPGVEKAIFGILQEVLGITRFDVFSYEGRRTALSLVYEAKKIADWKPGGLAWLRACSAESAEILARDGWLPEADKWLLRQSVNEMEADMVRRNVDVANLEIADLGLFANPDRAIKLISLHNSKGREFDAAALVCMNEGSVPHFSARTQSELNRPGFAGGSNFQIGWSHDEQNDEQVFP